MLAFKNSLPMIIHYSLDAIMPIYRELFSRFDVTEQQWRILRVVWDRENITLLEISRQTLLPAPSLVGILDRLEKKDLVSRVRPLHDRRNVHIIVTSKGRELQNIIEPLAEKIHNHFKNQLSDGEWNAMELALGKLKVIGKSNRLNHILGDDFNLNRRGAKNG